MKHLVYVVAVVAALGAFGGAESDAEELYTCAADPHDGAEALGLTLCDASPTDVLAARADSDNLQQRDGALVVELETDGVSDRAGFASGDLIYRIGGVDVTDAQSAAGRLGQIGARADTVVNFLRGGRPYRIKLRRE